MQVLGVYPGLTRHLLVAAARARREGEPPCDWTGLVERADISASPRAINRALTHLAEDGLIEGVYTRSGWMHLHATARGVRRAGGAARRPPRQRRITPSGNLDATELTHDEQAAAVFGPASEQEATAPAEHNAMPVAENAAASPAARLSAFLSLRVLALRAQLVQALNVFKTQP